MKGVIGRAFIVAGLCLILVFGFRAVVEYINVIEIAERIEKMEERLERVGNECLIDLKACGMIYGYMKEQESEMDYQVMIKKNLKQEILHMLISPVLLFAIYWALKWIFLGKLK